MLARPTPSESTKVMLVLCSRRAREWERTEEGDDTLGPPVSEIEWEGLLGPYDNKILHIQLHMGPKTLEAYIMTYFNLVNNYNGSSIVS